MSTIIDPATADLLFTCICSFSLLGMAGISLMCLPWTDAEIEATERAARSFLQPSPRPIQGRLVR